MLSGAAVQSANNNRKICGCHPVIFESRANYSLIEMHRKYLDDFMKLKEREIDLPVMKFPRTLQASWPLHIACWTSFLIITRLCVFLNLNMLRF